MHVISMKHSVIKVKDVGNMPREQNALKYVGYPREYFALDPDEIKFSGTKQSMHSSGIAANDVAQPPSAPGIQAFNVLVAEEGLTVTSHSASRRMPRYWKERTLLLLPRRPYRLRRRALNDDPLFLKCIHLRNRAWPSTPPLRPLVQGQLFRESVVDFIARRNPAEQFLIGFLKISAAVDDHGQDELECVLQVKRRA